MSDLWTLSMPWWEFILRAVAVYVIVLLMTRLSGKRSLGQSTAFDVLVIVLLGNAVQNSLIGQDSSLLGGLLLAATLLSLNWLVGFVTARNRRLDRLVEGAPVVLVRNGTVFWNQLRHCNLSPADLDVAMRSEGCRQHADIELAMLETSGRITITPRPD
ncbi:membrane protein [Stenotrophomonas chelatiphaga]|jgi:uncharacterized membrane protein YcaP (DUF421 family)|uniref:Membrane protein n=1 Tax=Stenotrophomonas chelatiphaga TaxID=517011 RepID=A0A0R0DAY9_9GAMM|nr:MULTISPECIES: YetF domain-containing protein [Stenotrophomonas]KRG75367.1 membrane protein [Stenotrophomonas chelatiphaga]MCS4229495.1 uncharacterized membrane protein YcaP (DUF421 family) [Stenotrophomonas chelatiphaga]MDR6094547.1 uncharacterized membrane protein YcaP (DUF421 family) [Stenotrophomonas sp. SORGH_AS_0321]ROQ46056.1 uncharacterized protein DUF421 [Stenotrophomonas maltophilia]